MNASTPSTNGLNALQRHPRPIGSCALRALLVALALALAGCTTMKVPATKVQSADAYPLNSQQKDLFVAVHPMTDKKDISDTFRTDLRGKGLLPILVVAENRSATSSFILAKEKVFVQKADSELNESTKRGQVKSGTGGEATAIAGAVVLLPSIVVGAPLLVGGLKLASDAQVIEHGLSDKEFYSRTLGPGQKAHGFIYFQVPKNETLEGRHHVVIQAVDASTRETLNFSFNLQ